MCSGAGVVFEVVRVGNGLLEGVVAFHDLCWIGIE
jgi:hypothetical protein